MVRARAVIAFENKNGERPTDLTHLPKLYFFEVLRMEHSKALRKYVPRPYDGEVVLFRAGKQLSGLVADDYLGWKTSFKRGFEICQVPGHQQNLMLEPNVRRLASELNVRLKAAQERVGAKKQ
jgi:thioesterase domain-containing protein